MKPAQGQWRFSVDERFRLEHERRASIGIRAELRRRTMTGFTLIHVQTTLLGAQHRQRAEATGRDPFIAALSKAFEEHLFALVYTYDGALETIRNAGRPGLHQEFLHKNLMQLGFARDVLPQGRSREAQQLQFDWMRDRIADTYNYEISSTEDLIASVNRLAPAGNLMVVVDEELMEHFRNPAGTLQIEV